MFNWFKNSLNKPCIKPTTNLLDEIVTKLEEEYKKRYGYNAGEMI